MLTFIASLIGFYVLIAAGYYGYLRYQEIPREEARSHAIGWGRDFYVLILRLFKE